MNGDTFVIDKYMNALCADAAERYAIAPSYFARTHRGLRNEDGTGVLVGATRIGSVLGYYMQDGERVPMEGRLLYRGISVEDIVRSHWEDGTFGYEEVAYLLLLGRLPNRREMELFTAMLSEARPLPSGFFDDMILKNPSPDVMNGLARSVLALYVYDHDPDDRSVENLMRQSVGLIARLPVIVAQTYAVKRHVYEQSSLYIHHPKDELSLAENFLRMARKDKRYTPLEARILDLMLILHAEHGGGNNSTFVCRAMSSSGTDTYAAIAGAIGALKGPLHGGANAKVRQMLAAMRERIDPDSSDGAIRDCLADVLAGRLGDGSGKIYGLGHAVYTRSDPRAVIIKRYAGALAQEKDRQAEMDLMERIERLGIELISEKRGATCANVDFYSGFVYDMLGINPELYTPLFAVARIAGWCAHRMEEVLTGCRIMRPAYRAVTEPNSYTSPAQRP